MSLSDQNRFSGRPALSPYGSRNFGIRYPSPFFDVAQQFLPESVRQLHYWCRYYFLTNPVINAACTKLAEYPVTRLLFDSDDEHVTGLYRNLEKRLKLREFQVEVGLDYFTYGTAFVSNFYPFLKFLVCRSCGSRFRADKNRSLYKWRSLRFYLRCPECKKDDYAREADVYIRSVRDIRVIRWNPENIDIRYNEVTGKSKVYFKIPRQIINDVTLGDPDTIETLPSDFLDAVRQSKSLLFNPDMIYVLKRPTIAQKDQGWGTPLIYPLLKDAFYLQILKKANECVSPDTWIETVGGLRQAKDVGVGDYVRSHTGKFRRVFDCWTRPIHRTQGERALRFTLSGLREYPSIFSPNHPLFVVRRNDVWRRRDTKEVQGSCTILRNPHLWDLDFVEAAQVRAGEYVAYPITRRVSTQPVVDVARYTGRTRTDGHVYEQCEQGTAEAFECLETGTGTVAFSGSNALKVARRIYRAGRAPIRTPRIRELTEDLAYVAGWYCGDGSIGARRADFSVGMDDPVDALQAALKRSFGKEAGGYHPRGTKKMLALSLCDSVAAEFLDNWLGHGAHNKRVPDEVMEAPDSVLLAFLRGLYEADGYFDAKRAVLTTVSPELAYQVRTALLSLGCIATVSRRDMSPYVSMIDDRQVQNGFVHAVVVSGRSRDRLRALLYGGEAPEVVSGKSGFFFKGYFLARILSVEEDPCPEVINFSVEEDHTFCTYGMATHNSIALEHVVPFRAVYPGPNTGGNDTPFGAYNLSNWKAQIDREINLWRRDPNYIAVLPVNVGFEQWGGDAKALVVHQEFRILNEQMLAGAGIPPEFIFGGLNWQASNTSLRALENMFLGYNRQREELTSDFVIGGIASFMGWPKVGARFDRFRMADDLQRSMFYLQLNQSEKVSDRRLAEELGEDHDLELRRMDDERKFRQQVQRRAQVGAADVQGEALVRSTRYQAKAMQLQTEAQAESQEMLAAQQGGQPQGPAAQPILNAVPPGVSAQGPPEGAGEPNEGRLPPGVAGMASPLQRGQGGVDLVYVAQRAAAYFRTLRREAGEEAAQQELQQLQTVQPQLYQMVLQLLNDRGDSTNPADASKTPAPAGSPPGTSPARTIG